MSDNNYRPAVGDRVRVVLEGEVGCVYGGDDRGFRLAGSPLTELEFNHSLVEDKVVSIQKMEPPVETFGPGDVVRRRSDGNYLALGDEGWVNLTTGKTYVGPEFHRSSFTSRSHERASVG